MSATGRTRDVRRKDDFYSTPGWCVDAMLRELQPAAHSVVCEPTAGSGAIVSRLLHYGCSDIQAFELDPVRAQRLFELPISVCIGDVTQMRPRRVPTLTVGNPPYCLAQSVIERCLGWTDGVVAMLLRLDFLGPKCRSPFLRACPPDVWVLNKRPSFCSNVRWEIGWSDQKGWHRKGEPFLSFEQAENKLNTMPINGHALTIKKQKVSNDSCEYAWMLWGLPGGGGHWRILEAREDQ